jgi:hypothetical protein
MGHEAHLGAAFPDAHIFASDEAVVVSPHVRPTYLADGH